MCNFPLHTRHEHSSATNPAKSKVPRLAAPVGGAAMGNASSMLTQYDIEEVQEHCNYLFSQQEIVSLYKRFCQLDRSAKGFISEDEFLSIPEFSLNPLSKRLLRMVDGLNFKDFVSFLSTFSVKASICQKIEWIFKVYDIDGKGKVTFRDLVEVLRDQTGSFMTDEQREQVLTNVLGEAGYTWDCTLSLDDFIQIIDHPGLKMEVEVPID
ncbi:hypothetical protein GUJ93_ZPchr0002g23945 [Zizania palustris]|uniref:EF-hand domain-containing protein n=1 Tax=Zizania palustris TaxID=103762 RepID=A0A8J5VUL9_ZIZPA|nr:hypothetical protein GUJ93_ZPchr0002g23945 [Zizania palustris]